MKIGGEIRTVSEGIAVFMVRGIGLVALVVMAAVMASAAVVLVTTLRLGVGRMIALSSDSVSKLINVANCFLALSWAHGLLMSWKQSLGIANWPLHSSYPRKQ